MKTYEQIVAFHRKKESGEILHNLAVDNAEVLFRNLLEIAAEKNEDVCIYSGTLHRKFYERLTETVRKTLEKSKVFVAVANSAEENEVANNGFAEIVKDSDNGTLEEGARGLDTSFPHFILVGDKRYRLEKDDDTKEAIACFNDPTLGNVLLGACKKLKGNT